MILPVSFVQGPRDEPYCNLPESIAREFTGSGIVAFQLDWPDNVEDDSSGAQKSVVCWCGGVSKRNPDAIELPLWSFGTGKQKHHELVHISDHISQQQMLEASEIYLDPKSGYDWEIVSTQAGFVENTLLRYLAIVFVNQTIQVPISLSLKAQLRVSKIVLTSGQVLEGETAAAASSMMLIDAIVPSLRSIIRISSNTLVMVAPYKEPAYYQTSNRLPPAAAITTTSSHDDATYSNKPNMKDNDDNISRSEDPANNYMLDFESILKAVSAGSGRHTLRTLPSIHRYVDTSYRHKPTTAAATTATCSAVAGTMDAVVNNKLLQKRKDGLAGLADESSWRSSGEKKSVEDILNDILSSSEDTGIPGIGINAVDADIGDADKDLLSLYYKKKDNESSSSSSSKRSSVHHGEGGSGGGWRTYQEQQLPTAATATQAPHSSSYLHLSGGEEVRNDPVISGDIDDLSCFVHPSYFEACLGVSIPQGDVAAYKRFIQTAEERYQRYLCSTAASYSCCCFIGSLSLSSSSKSHNNTSSDASGNGDHSTVNSNIAGSTSSSTTASPLNTSVIVRVRCSEYVRPYNVSVPPCVRKVLGIVDFDKLLLRILDDSVSGPIMPRSIELHPILWRETASYSSSAGGDSGSIPSKGASPAAAAGPLVINGKGFDLSSNTHSTGSGYIGEFQPDARDVQAALSRLYDRHHHRPGGSSGPPLILSDGAILSLSVATPTALYSEGGNYLNCSSGMVIEDAITSSSVSPGYSGRRNLSSISSPSSTVHHHGGVVSVDYLVKLRTAPTSRSSVQQQSNPSRAADSIGGERQNYVVIESDEMMLDLNEIVTLGAPPCNAFISKGVISDILAGSSGTMESFNTLDVVAESSSQIEFLSSLVSSSSDSLGVVSGAVLTLDVVLATSSAAKEVVVDVMSVLLPRAVYDRMLIHHQNITDTATSTVVAASHAGAIAAGAGAAAATINAIATNDTAACATLASSSSGRDYDSSNTVIRTATRTSRSIPPQKTPLFIPPKTPLFKPPKTPLLIPPKTPLGSVLVGPSLSGKTCTLKSVCNFLRKCPHTLCHTEYLDCNTIRGLPMRTVLHTLTGVFAHAEVYSPSLIALDNLDAICPAPSEELGPANEHSRIISMHLEILLANAQQRMDADIAAAVRAVHEAASVLVTEDICDISQVVQPPTTVLIESVARTLHGAVYVLATAQADNSLYPTLTNNLRGCLRRIINIAPLGGKERLRILQTALDSLGAPLPLTAANTEPHLAPVSSASASASASSPSSSAHTNSHRYSHSHVSSSIVELRSRLTAMTEGYRPGDLWNLARKIFSYVARKYAAVRDVGYYSTEYRDSPMRSKNMQTSLEDAIAVTEGFSPISSTDISTQASSLSSSALWRDIGGYADTKKKIVDIFERPVIFRRLFRKSPIRMPRALLLYGPPGCGKTVLAQAAGNECGLAFLSVRGPELLNKYIGASERAVRDLFERARATGRPCIIFFDEFEALAPRRGKDNTGVTDRVVNQLLTCIDGAEATMGSNSGTGDDGTDEADADAVSGGQVFILAATSRPDLIDVALLRPGRVERHVYVGFPGEIDRAEILRVALRPLHCTGSEDDVEDAVRSIARHPKSSQFTPADLKALVNTAFLAATQEFLDSTGSSSNSSSNRSSVNVDGAGTVAGSAAAGTCSNSSYVVSGSAVAVTIHGRHLLDAFQQTRPCISERDRKYYDDIYAKFQQRSDHANPKIADSTSLDINKQRVSLM